MKVWSKIIAFFFLAGIVVLSSCENRVEEKPVKVGEVAPQFAELGKPAPDFMLQDINGKSWRLSDFRGKVVLVNFWASWCGPCRQELPAMQALHMAMSNEPFQMLSVSYNDDPRVANQLAQQVGVTFPVLADPQKQAATAYALTGVPETYIVDPQGILREKYLGARHWNSNEVVAMLRSYMK
jgi:peroxiredoxin